jgi:hypothetical protein
MARVIELRTAAAIAPHDEDPPIWEQGRQVAGVGGVHPAGQRLPTCPGIVTSALARTRPEAT